MPPTRLIRAFPRPEAGGVEYDNDASGLTGDTLQEAIDELAALIGTGNFETKNEGGEPTVDDHGTAGATETIDATDGNHHRLVLDQNCTITVNAFPDGTIIVAVYQDGTGGWDITWSGVTFAGDDQPDQTASSLTFFVLISEDGAVYGGKFGGGGSALTVEDEGTPLATAATTLDFVGAGVTASGTGAEKTITIPGVTSDEVRDAGRWEHVTEPGSSAPPVDVYSPDGTEWVYSWVTD